ncbi:MAG: hypothetical protein WBP54_10305, partial [Pelodictyon phaeoclathratiforme]
MYGQFTGTGKVLSVQYNAEQDQLSILAENLHKEVKKNEVVTVTTLLTLEYHKGIAKELSAIQVGELIGFVGQFVSSEGGYPIFDEEYRFFLQVKNISRLGVAAAKEREDVCDVAVLGYLGKDAEMRYMPT